MFFFRLDPSSVGRLTCAAFMGAPLIISEKLVSGYETSLAFDALQRVLASGLYREGNEGRKGNEHVKVTQRQLSGGNQAWVADVDDLKKIDISNPSSIEQVSFNHIQYDKAGTCIYACTSCSAIGWGLGC